ncbi:Gfo/Idh/MocA family oxidoreductase [uncultured Sphingomonas sp.]|uniref:Gfo/Idh/MocA family protein n=1 Tax=uncultured Sphingomonas sp. TaxID=158754 RepID=UPI0025E9C2DA|nr:Gfo/Idh/MocA family oxidoreductase [uncultured Sphingomonas sp.]
MPEPISRRSLIELGLTGATVAMSGVARARAPAADKERVGFAVVGLGKLALGQIVPALKKTRVASLAAVVSGHPDKAQRVAAEQGLPADAIYSYDDYDRIVRDPRIQVVYIVLPNAMHAEYTIRAFKAGKHVLCEKPMATSVADCEAMIAAGKAADRRLMIAYRCLTEPLNVEAMRCVRSGSLGRPRLVTTQMTRQSTLDDPSDVWRLDGKMSGGGALMDMGIYGIHASRYLLNEEPVEVSAWSQTDRNDPRFRTVEDLYSWQFRFPSGAIAEGSTSFNASAEMGYQVTGERGRLVADPGCFYNGNHLSLVDGGSRKDIPITEVDQFAQEMDWMAQVVRGRAPMLAPGEEGLQDVRLIQAIMQSAAVGGRTIRTDFGYRRPADPAQAVRS